MPKGIKDHNIWRRAKNQIESSKKKYRNKYAVISSVYQSMGGRYNESNSEGETEMGKSYEDIGSSLKITQEDLYRVTGENLSKVGNKAIDNRNKSLGTITTLKDGLPDKSKMNGKKGKPKTAKSLDANIDEAERICKGIISRLARGALGAKGVSIAGKGLRAAERGIKAGGRATQGLGSRIHGASMARRGVIPTTGTRVGGALQRAGRFAEKNPGAVGGAGVVGAVGGLGYLASKKKRKRSQEAEYEGTKKSSSFGDLAKLASSIIMKGKNARGKRDGTGPYKHSAQRSISDKGRRQMAGEPCPVNTKKKGKKK